MAISQHEVEQRLRELSPMYLLRNYHYRNPVGNKIFVTIKDVGKSCINGRFHFFTDLIDKTIEDHDRDDADPRCVGIVSTDGKRGCVVCNASH